MSQTLQPTKELREEIQRINVLLGQRLAEPTLTAEQAILGQNQDVEMLKKIKKHNKFITAFTEEKYEY